MISKEEIAKGLHPLEKSRHTVAIATCFILLVATLGSILLLILVASLIRWIALRISEAKLCSNGIIVSEINFRDIYRIAEDVKIDLDYKERISIFIANDGDVNASTARFFKSKYIVLTSGLVESMSGAHNEIQLKWIIARFIGDFKARRVRSEWVKVFIDKVRETQLFNFFILPYDRKLVYSGDNIGLIVCKNLNEVMKAFDKLLIGKELSTRLNYRGVLEQSINVEGSFFSKVSKLLSTHPHMISRYLNLLAFARKQFPEQFEQYVEQFDTTTASSIGSMLPKYYLRT